MIGSSRDLSRILNVLHGLPAVSVYVATFPGCSLEGSLGSACLARLHVRHILHKDWVMLQVCATCTWSLQTLSCKSRLYSIHVTFDSSYVSTPTEPFTLPLPLITSKPQLNSNSIYSKPTLHSSPIHFTPIPSTPKLSILNPFHPYPVHFNVVPSIKLQPYSGWAPAPTQIQSYTPTSTPHLLNSTPTQYEPRPHSRPLS